MDTSASVEDGDFTIVMMKHVETAKRVKSSSDHRASCHRCGNMRKSVLRCTMCPYVFCNPCTTKMQEEHGDCVFVDGCPVCKNLCCCGPEKSVSCDKVYHCYKKCPASRSQSRPDSSPKEKGTESSTILSAFYQQADNLVSPLQKSRRLVSRKRKTTNQTEQTSKQSQRKLKMLSNSTSAEMYYPSNNGENARSNFRNETEGHFGAGVPMYVGNDSCFFDDIPSHAFYPGFSLKAPVHDNSDTESEISLPIDTNCPASISDAGDILDAGDPMTDGWGQNSPEGCQCGASDPTLCPWNHQYANYGACVQGPDGTPCDDCRHNYETCVEGPDGAPCEDCRRLCGFGLYPLITSTGSVTAGGSKVADAENIVCPICYPSCGGDASQQEDIPFSSLSAEEGQDSFLASVVSDGVDPTSSTCPQCIDGAPCAAAVYGVSLSNYSYCMEAKKTAKRSSKPRQLQSTPVSDETKHTASNQKPHEQQADSPALDCATAEKDDGHQPLKAKSRKRSLFTPKAAAATKTAKAATATAVAVPEAKMPTSLTAPNEQPRPPEESGTRISARIWLRIEKQQEQERAAAAAAAATAVEEAVESTSVTEARRPRLKRSRARRNRSFAADVGVGACVNEKGPRDEKGEGKSQSDVAEDTPISDNSEGNVTTASTGKEACSSLSHQAGNSQEDPQDQSVAAVAGAPSACTNDDTFPEDDAALECSAVAPKVEAHQLLTLQENDVSVPNSSPNSSILLPPQTPTAATTESVRVEESPWTQALRAPHFEPHEYPLGILPDFVISQPSPSSDLGHLSTPTGAVSLVDMIVAGIRPDGLSLVEDEDLNAVAGALCGLGSDTFHMNFVSPPRTAFEAPDAVEVAKELDAWYSTMESDKGES